MWIDIIAISSLVFLSISLFNLLGNFFFSNPEKPALSFFINTLLGSLILVCLYAMLNTSFITIHASTLLLIFGYLFIEKKRKFKSYQNSKDHFQFKSYLITACVSFLTVIIAVAYPFKGFIEEDVSFYTHIAGNLTKTGNENVYHYLGQIIGVKGTSPYHYYELWMGALLFKLKWLGMADAIIFRYGCYCIIRTMVVLGFLALIETIKKINLLDALLVTSFTMFQTYYLADDSWAIQTNVWLRPNLGPYYILLLASFTMLLYKKYSEALFFTLLLPTFSVATLPSVFISTGLGLLLLIFIHRRDKIQLTLFIKWLIAAILFAVAIMIFYRFTSITNKQLVLPKYQSFSEIIKYLLSIWKAIVGFIITLQLRAYLLMLIPCFLFFLIYQKKVLDIVRESAPIILFSILLTAVGIIIFQLTAFIDNSYQFPYVGYSACYITGGYLIYQLYNSIDFTYSVTRSLLTSLVFLLLFIYNLYYIKPDLKSDFISASHGIGELNLQRKGYSGKYISEIRNYFSNYPGANGGFINSATDLNERQAELLSLTFQLGSSFSYIGKQQQLMPLTNPKDLYAELDSTALFYHKAKSFNDRLPFYKSVHEMGYDTILQQYLCQEKIDFIVAGKQFDPKNLKNIPIKKIISDSGEGPQFIILDTSAVQKLCLK